MQRAFSYSSFFGMHHVLFGPAKAEQSQRTIHACSTPAVLYELDDCLLFPDTTSPPSITHVSVPTITRMLCTSNRYSSSGLTTSS